VIAFQYIGARGPAAGAIDWLSCGHLSHVDVIDTRHGRYQLVGARSDGAGGMGPGVWPRKQGYFGNVARRLVLQLETTPEQERVFWRFIDGQIGLPYDHTAILAFAFNRDWREPDSWFCSELQQTACEVAGMVPVLYQRPNKVTPVMHSVIVQTRGAKDVTDFYPIEQIEEAA